jgi:SAM-dependent methyltransferase
MTPNDEFFPSGVSHESASATTDKHEQRDRTRLGPESSGGLREIEIQHPAGTFRLTPASHITLQAIGQNRQLLAGIGLDWGCGSGCLAIAAATLPAVRRVVGFDIVEANVAVARSNAALNGVAEKARFLLSDSYSPASIDDRDFLDALAGKVNFILANPPASDGDDGFGYRRIVLEGARRFLAAGGVVFLNVSLQYGPQRIERLAREAPGFEYRGAIASTDWVPFDLDRPDLLRCLKDYVGEETRGGSDYAFRMLTSRGGADAGQAENANARSALLHFHRSGQSPLSKWQTHLFVFRP